MNHKERRPVEVKAAVNAHVVNQIVRCLILLKSFCTALLLAATEGTVEAGIVKRARDILQTYLLHESAVDVV